MPAPQLSTPQVRDAALGAAALAAVTLPDPARLGPTGRHLLRLGSAAVGAWAGWRVARDEVPFVPPHLFGAAAGAAVVLALAPVEEATDRWLDGRLRAAGLRSPRPVMALAVAGLGALAWATDSPSREDDQLMAVDDLYHDRELDLALREIVRAMLEAGEPAAAQVALAQLGGARAQVLGDDGFQSTVMVSVGDGVTRLVPHTQVWPVRARWSIGEHPVELSLQIHDGRLEHVALMPSESEYGEGIDPFEVTPVDDPGNSWPGVDQVSLVQDTPEGVRPVAAGRPS